MGGFFGVVSREDCVADLFYGTDYHSHLGTARGGMVVRNGHGFKRNIHDISNAPFRTKFEDDLVKYGGNTGLGVISDTEDQPLLIASRHGSYAIVTVGRVENVDALARQTLSNGGGAHYSEMKGNTFNATEVVASLINGQDTLVAGLQHVQASVVGSCSILLLADDGLYAARDRLGRTVVTLGRKDGAQAVTMETCALPNLGYEVERHLGPGEIVRGTQLKDVVSRSFDAGAREVHMRPACPPLVHGCRFLNFSQSKSELDLAARRAVKALEGDANARLDDYANPSTDRYQAMVDWIRNNLGLTTLQYQNLDDMVAAIGLLREKLCTYCWNGESAGDA